MIFCVRNSGNSLITKFFNNENVIFPGVLCGLIIHAYQLYNLTKFERNVSHLNFVSADYFIKTEKYVLFFILVQKCLSGNNF